MWCKMGTSKVSFDDPSHVFCKSRCVCHSMFGIHGAHWDLCTIESYARNGSDCQVRAKRERVAFHQNAMNFKQWLRKEKIKGKKEKVK